MKSTDVVGYTHSDGYALCVRHAHELRIERHPSDTGKIQRISGIAVYGELEDSENESGFVQPIFADSEWDSFPTCDACMEAITDVALTSDGIAYYLARGKEGRDILDAAYIWYDMPEETAEE